MSVEVLKAELKLVRPEACGDCIEQCILLNRLNDEGFLCLRAVAEGRNGDVRKIGDRDLRELVMDAPDASTQEKWGALKFVFDDFDRRYPEA